ncbi:hypothetical protein [Hydrogenimonas sp.]
MAKRLATALILMGLAGCGAKEAPTTSPHAQRQYAHEALESLDADTKR